MVFGTRDRAPVVPVPWVDGTDAARVAVPSWLGARRVSELADDAAPPSSASEHRGERSSHVAVTGGLLPSLAQGDAPGLALPAPAEEAESADAVVHALEAELAAMEAALAELAEKNRALETQVATMALSAEKVRRQLFEGCERSAVELAVAIAERIVGRELRTDPGVVVQWVRQALEALSDGEDLEVRVARDVFESVPAETWQAVGGGRIVPIVDPRLGPGSCEVTSAVSRIDLSLSKRVRAVVDALGASEGHG